MKFSLARFLVFPSSRFLILAIAVTLLITHAHAQVVSIPDPNLEKAIREALKLSDETAVTQQEMQNLRVLDINGNRGITNLTGLEYALNLDYLSVGDNQIRDIHPLAGLINLTGLGLFNNEVQDIAPLTNLTNLTYLDLGGNAIKTIEPLAGLIRLEGLALWGNEVQDIVPLTNLTGLTRLYLENNNIEFLEPLAGLIRLQRLDLSNNRVRDIIPLANLTDLTDLILTRNQVSDLTPLANLVNLERLYIQDNLVADFTPISGLSLIELHYDEACDIAPLLPSVEERIENRSFPSVFQAWDHVIGLDHLTLDQRYALHDLHWSPFFDLYWRKHIEGPAYGVATSLTGDFERAREVRQRRLDQNPNMVFLVEVRLHNHFTPEALPSDSDVWLRDAQGQIVQNNFTEYLIDLLKPEVQDLIAKRIIAVARCGLYDGVLLDGFLNNGTGFVGRHLHSATDAEIMTATENILHTVRQHVRDDFLILINTNRSKATRYVEYVNGTFMEIGKDHPGGYTYAGLKEIESTLLWSEENFREPQINSLEGWGVGAEAPDSPNNRRWMRVFTTMSLILSDGYVLYNTGRNIFGNPDHEHLWYPFWDADLGLPIGTKAQQYQNNLGTFIREFTNGWVVYNRSGKAQTITLPASAAPVSDRENNSPSTTHLLPDLDGEIYLKAKNPADVNGDWVVNILDLVQVANGIGKSAPDPNGDGIVNILDLVFVTQQFSQ